MNQTRTTALLNSAPADGMASTKMLAEARAHVQDAEKVLLTRQAKDFEEYIANFTKLQALMALQSKLQETYDRTFNV